MIAISVFDYTTTMMQPWAEAGYTCYCVDLQHPEGETQSGNIIKVGADAMDWSIPAGEIAFASFFPPCTDVAVSGARHFKDKGLPALIKALQLFNRSIELANDAKCPWMIENPVNTVSTYWRSPNHAFHPYDYGDPYTKQTWLWVGGGFLMPEKTPTFPLMGSKMHRLPPSKDRANLRSATPPGFARAVFEANRPDRPKTTLKIGTLEVSV